MVEKKKQKEFNEEDEIKKFEELQEQMNLIKQFDNDNIEYDL
jgi:hypothetical protein